MMGYLLRRVLGAVAVVAVLGLLRWVGVLP